MIRMSMVTVVTAMTAMGCSSDGDKKPSPDPIQAQPMTVDAGTAVIVDAGVVVTVDAGPSVVDAGVVVDAGPSATTTATPAGVGLGEAGRAQANRLAIQNKTTDRIMVKPRDDMRNPNDIVALIKKELKLEVVSIRRTAGTWYLLTFAATDPPRDLDAQRALIASLIKTDAFLKVEGDRVMTLK